MGEAAFGSQRSRSHTPTIIVISWHPPPTRDYQDLGADYYEQRDPQREADRLVRRLQKLGHTVTLAPAS
ncbi:MAG: hypothetical protein U5R31_17120 [Acidimicrobiia bacterium]|nr:hypothetical protein [Acidimicrobiia bacterium]